MDLRPYVESLRDELLTAAEAGGDEALALAERLIAPLDAATRLTLLEALSTATDEITRDLAPGSVELRLRGLTPTFVVSKPEIDTAEVAPPQSVGSPPADDGPTARINFRPPEHLKARIEEAANAEGTSVNAWLVRAVSATLDNPPRRRSRGGVGDRITGWAR